MRAFATILVAVVSFGAANAWTKDYFNRSGLAFPLLLESESDVGKSSRA